MKEKEFGWNQIFDQVRGAEEKKLLYYYCAVSRLSELLFKKAIASQFVVKLLKTNLAELHHASSSGEF